MTEQSVSNAIHPFRRLTTPEVAPFFRAENDRIALPASAMMSHYCAEVHIRLPPDKNPWHQIRTNCTGRFFTVCTY